MKKKSKTLFNFHPELYAVEADNLKVFSIHSNIFGGAYLTGFYLKKDHDVVDIAVPSGNLYY